MITNLVGAEVEFTDASADGGVAEGDPGIIVAVWMGSEGPAYTVMLADGKMVDVDGPDVFRVRPETVPYNVVEGDGREPGEDTD